MPRVGKSTEKNSLSLRVEEKKGAVHKRDFTVTDKKTGYKKTFVLSYNSARNGKDIHINRLAKYMETQLPELIKTINEAKRGERLTLKNLSSMDVSFKCQEIEKDDDDEEEDDEVDNDESDWSLNKISANYTDKTKTRTITLKKDKIDGEDIDDEELTDKITAQFEKISGKINEKPNGVEDTDSDSGTDTDSENEGTGSDTENKNVRKPLKTKNLEINYGAESELEEQEPIDDISEEEELTEAEGDSEAEETGSGSGSVTDASSDEETSGAEEEVVLSGAETEVPLDDAVGGSGEAQEEVLSDDETDQEEIFANNNQAVSGEETSGAEEGEVRSDADTKDDTIGGPGSQPARPDRDRNSVDDRFGGFSEEEFNPAFQPKRPKRRVTETIKKGVGAVASSIANGLSGLVPSKKEAEIPYASGDDSDEW